MKLRPGVKFSISTEVEKYWCYKLLSARDEKNLFFLLLPLVKIKTVKVKAFRTKQDRVEN